MTGDDSQPADPRSFRLRALAFLGILLLAAFLRGRDLDTPFGESFRAINATVYFGLFDRNLREYGFEGTRGGLVFMGWPGTAEGMTRDVNHPPTPLYLFALGTRISGEHTELGLRLVPFLASLLGVFALARLARVCGGRDAGVIAALIAATSPMWAYYGVMVVAQCFLLLWGSLIALSTLRYLEGRGSFGRLGLLFFAGCLLDWPFYFFAPGAVVAALVLRAERRKLRRLLWLFPIGTAAFGLFVAHAAWCMGGLSELFDELRKTADTAAALEFTATEWGLRQLRALKLWYGLPLLGTVAASVIGVAFVRRPSESAHEGASSGRRVAAAASLFLVAGGIDLILFPQHSYDHEFWSMGIAGGLYLVAAVGLAAALRRPGFVRCVGILLLVLTAGLGIRDTWQAQEAERTDANRVVGAFYDSFLDPDAIVFTSEPLPLPQLFYIRARVFPHIRSYEDLDPWILKIQRMKLKAPLVLMLREYDVIHDPKVRDLAKRIEAFGASLERHADRRFGRFRVYSYTPPW